ncbi:MAG: hypothetical protein ABEJ44_03630 [Halanaeroarchaeum sp.]
MVARVPDVPRLVGRQHLVPRVLSLGEVREVLRPTWDVDPSLVSQARREPDRPADGDRAPEERPPGETVRRTA